MIFGIYGAYATGKTTFVKSIIPEPDMVRVFGDVRGIEDDADPKFRKFTTSKSVRVMNSKIELIQCAAADRNRLWVIEGCRFWGSMLGRARAIIDNNQGGMFFLIVTTTGKMMERELRRRAQIHNKPYRAEYWGKAKLEYDAGVRQLNAVKKHLHPDEYAHIIFKGDFSIWDGVPYHLLTEFYNNKDLWYDNPDQR